MANHGFITTKRNLSAKEISVHLAEINNRRFKGKFSIDFNEESEEEWISWNINLLIAEILCL